jgi:hypothetical protein
MTCVDCATGVIGNLRAGKGIFGEKTTMSFSRAVMKTAGLDPNAQQQSDAVEAPAKYTDTDKWSITVTGPIGQPMEVTIRPTQKAGLLLKAWMADNDVQKGYALPGGVDAEMEIGRMGVKDGGSVKIIAV